MSSLVMFDLDGTLVDSKRGILHSLTMTLEGFGVQPPPGDDMVWCIGSSLWNIFEHYLGTSDHHVLDAAVARYRHIYRDGPMFEYDIYDGIPGLLESLSNSGVRCVLATAKAHEYAREVIETSPLAPWIAHVYGSELDGRNVEKPDLIRSILAAEGSIVHRAVMVGDRHHDIRGAHANGVPAIGVTYGYGQADELHDADRLAHSAHDLGHALYTLLSRPS